MTITQTTTTTKTPAARPRRPRKASSSDSGGSPRIGRPTRYEGEKDKKLVILTVDAISIAEQLAEREGGISFSNAVEKAIRAAGAGANIHPIAKVRV